MTAELFERLSALVSREPFGRTSNHLVHCLIVFALMFAVLLSDGMGRDGEISALLRGPDDFMRLVQVVDWLDGQGWSDTVQRRLNPPAGVAMHWSRLADVHLAGAIRLFEPWFGRDGAVFLTALLVPPLLGGLFAALFLWATFALVPERRAHVPVLMIGALLYPLREFLPGRVDHHGLQLVLTTLSVCLLIRTLERGGSRAAAALGIVGGTSLAIGLETLPFLGAATVILCLAWTMGDRSAATRLAIFGSAMTASVLVLIPLTLPRSEWGAVVCDRLSLVHAAMTAIVLVAGAGAVALERFRRAASRLARLAAVGGVGTVGLALVAARFPQCAGGPYSNVSSEIRYWLDNVSETQSLLDAFRAQPDVAVSAIILPLAAMAVLTVQWTRSDDRTDSRWIALAVLAASGVALMTWQVRGAAYSNLVACLALIPLAATLNERAGGLKRALPRMGLMLCLPMTCAAAAVVPLVLANPAPSRAADAWNSACDLQPALEELTSSAGLGTEARTIAAPIDHGPGILLLSRHQVLAAPYHRNARGLADHRRIFAGTEEESLATVRARNVGAIVYCRKFEWVTAYPNRPAFLSQRLDAGRPPWWLVPVRHDGDTYLFRVHPAALSRPIVIPNPGKSS